MYMGRDNEICKEAAYFLDNLGIYKELKRMISHLLIVREVVKTKRGDD